MARKKVDRCLGTVALQAGRGGPSPKKRGKRRPREDREENRGAKRACRQADEDETNAAVAVASEEGPNETAMDAPYIITQCGLPVVSWRTTSVQPQQLWAAQEDDDDATTDSEDEEAAIAGLTALRITVPDREEDSIPAPGAVLKRGRFSHKEEQTVRELCAMLGPNAQAIGLRMDRSSTSIQKRLAAMAADQEEEDAADELEEAVVRIDAMPIIDPLALLPSGLSTRRTSPIDRLRNAKEEEQEVSGESEVNGQDEAAAGTSSPIGVSTRCISPMIVDCLQDAEEDEISPSSTAPQHSVSSSTPPPPVLLPLTNSRDPDTPCKPAVTSPSAMQSASWKKPPPHTAKKKARPETAKEEMPGKLPRWEAGGGRLLQVQGHLRASAAWQ